VNTRLQALVKFFRLLLLVAMSSLLQANSVHAAVDVVAIVNSLRNNGCGAKLAPLASNTKLNQAATQLMRGKSPHDAARAADYQAMQLASIQLSGYTNELALKQILREHYCATLGDRNLQHIGIAQRDGETWILLGVQLQVPQDPQAAADRVLDLVNEARSHGHSCGSQNFVATAPLALNSLLTAAAQAHSDEMARYSYLEHKGRDGTTPAQRVTTIGYAWSHTGENIAGGPGSPEDVVAGWLKSPGHCANIMSPKFTEMGVAYALSNDDYGIYWTQVFAAPANKTLDLSKNIER